MKVSTPQIAFHGRPGGKNDPIMSIAHHPSLNVIATSGGDNEIKIWKLDTTKEDESPFIYVFTITGHQKCVNSVKFSPDGVSLASCSDDGRIVIYRVTLPLGETKDDEQRKVSARELLWEQVTEERDISRKYLRGHGQDVFDLAWSNDSKHLISCSMDGVVYLWDVNTGKSTQSFTEHNHFVQGVCWDPYQHFFCSQSADRTVKIYRRQKEKVGSNTSDQEMVFKFKNKLSERLYSTIVNKASPQQEGSQDSSAGTPATEETRKTSQQVIYLDDSLSSYFRRLAWSPDGSLLVTPAGQYKQKKNDQPVPTTYVYQRGKWQSPALHLPGTMKPSVGVRFNPVLFQKKGGSAKAWLDTPYRMVFAVLTMDSVFIYDTQHQYPIAAAEQLHFSQLTDAAWSNDGLSLVISSNDGYCSVLSFDENELGEQYPIESIPEVVQRKLYQEETEEKKEEMETNSTKSDQSSSAAPQTNRRRIALEPVLPKPDTTKTDDTPQREGDHHHYHHRQQQQQQQQSGENEINIMSVKRKISPTLIAVEASPEKKKKIQPTLVVQESPDQQRKVIQPELIQSFDKMEEEQDTSAEKQQPKKIQPTLIQRRVEPSLISEPTNT